MLFNKYFLNIELLVLKKYNSYHWVIPSKLNFAEFLSCD